MASLRRKEYLPISNERFKVYHDCFDRTRVNSKILNETQNVPGMFYTFFDRREMLYQEQMLEGSMDKTRTEANILIFGRYFDTSSNRWKYAYIPFLRALIESYEQDFRTYQQSRVNAGFDKPTVWPVELFEKKLVAEAKLDVRIEELESVKLWLKNFKLKEDTTTDDMVLAYGLQQVSHTNEAGVLKDIDGQTVKFIGDVLCVCDKRSRFNGLAVSDYRHLAVQWKEGVNEALNEKLKKYEEDQLAGKPAVFPGVKHGRVDPASLPTFPKDCVNHLEKADELTEKQKKLIRKAELSTK